ncbi:hypothetical protein BOTBODRAFT_617704 [Botryobasidium botryosum FD-172 SS1]|uniref:Uncharacterized protein n=1 Tax=Botryobasidium botryosum (strain FD-172 SS1) TaxID=930990 RepID=A0A067M6C6_BOTB1|nr:hypothetical protein BOTBODRAFT_617704 [Botryobasidium botryosum FD-172 SS1]
MKRWCYGVSSSNATRGLKSPGVHRAIWTRLCSAGSSPSADMGGLASPMNASWLLNTIALSYFCNLPTTRFISLINANRFSYILHTPLHVASRNINSVPSRALRYRQANKVQTGDIVKCRQEPPGPLLIRPHRHEELPLAVQQHALEGPDCSHRSGPVRPRIAHRPRGRLLSAFCSAARRQADLIDESLNALDNAPVEGDKNVPADSTELVLAHITEDAMVLEAMVSESTRVDGPEVADIHPRDFVLRVPREFLLRPQVVVRVEVVLTVLPASCPFVTLLLAPWTVSPRFALRRS